MEQHSTAAPAAAVRGLAVVMIHVSDLDRAARFYRDVLGFADAEQMLSPGLTLQAGDATIYLEADRAAAPGPRTHDAPEITLCLVVQGLREAVQRLRDADVPIIDAYAEASEFFASVGIADPDGNPVMLWGRP